VVGAFSVPVGGIGWSLGGAELGFVCWMGWLVWGCGWGRGGFDVRPVVGVFGGRSWVVGPLGAVGARVGLGVLSADMAVGSRASCNASGPGSSTGLVPV
jgi:hypothetical protein